jgi:alpha-galactosidase
MLARVTDSPNWVNNRSTSVEYRFLSSMQGSLGVGANLDKWTPDDFAVGKEMIEPINKCGRPCNPALSTGSSLRKTIANILRRSLSRWTSGRLSSSIFSTPARRGILPPRYLRGLDPTRQYTCALSTALRHWMLRRSPAEAYWMSHGIEVLLRGDFQAAGVVLEATAAH